MSSSRRALALSGLEGTLSHLDDDVRPWDWHHSMGICARIASEHMSAAGR